MTERDPGFHAGGYSVSELGDALLRIIPSEQLRPEVEPELLYPWDFDTDTVDIYDTFRCHGAGTERNEDLCTYCLLNVKQLRDPNAITQEQFETITGWLTQKGSPITTIALVGGEVALDPGLRDKIIHADYLGLGIHLVTNGSNELLDLLRNSALTSIFQKTTSRIAISLDSINSTDNDDYRGRGAWAKAVGTIEMCQARGFAFRINATPVSPTAVRTTQLCAFAEDCGAQELLIHRPSAVGRGLRIMDRRFENSKAPDALLGRSTRARPRAYPENSGLWATQVLQPVQRYMRHRKSRDNFTITAQLGNFGRGLPGEDPYTCDMRPAVGKRGGKNLQFCPPMNTYGDIPVVACGLDMERATKASAYIFRVTERGLYTRAGDSELTEIKYTDGLAGCPQYFDSSDHITCIYRVLQHDPTD